MIKSITVTALLLIPLLLTSASCNRDENVTAFKSNSVIEDGTHSSTEGSQIIEVHDGLFLPAEVIIQAGESVTWLNLDEKRHSIVSLYHYQDEDNISHIFLGGTWDSGDIQPRQSFTRIFKEPGTYEYVTLPLRVKIPMDQYVNFAQSGVGVVIVR